MCEDHQRSNLTRLARVTLPPLSSVPSARWCTQHTRHGRRRFTGRHQERPGDPFAHDVNCWPLGRTTAGYATTTDKEHWQAERRLAAAAGQDGGFHGRLGCFGAMKPSPDLALAVMTAWQWRQYGLLPAKEGGGRKRARHRGQTTDAAWKQAADRARPGDAVSWVTAVTRVRAPLGMRPRCGWPGGMGRAAANGMGGGHVHLISHPIQDTDCTPRKRATFRRFC